MARTLSKKIYDPIKGEIDLTESNSSRQKRAILYLRVSTEDQAKKHSTDSQLDTCRLWCERNEVIIDAIFEDEAISGKHLGRDGLTQVIDHLKKMNKKKKVIDYVVSRQLSRIARPELVHKGIGKLAEIWDNHSEIVDAQESIVYDQYDDMKIIMSTLKLSQAKSERENARMLSHSGKLSRLRQGYYVFMPPMGYATEKKT